MGYKQKRAKTPPADRNYVQVTVYLPRSIHDVLKAKSEKSGMPVARLIAYAIDNEICEGAELAFEYPCEMPQTIFVEGAYTDEAQRIYKWLTKVNAQGVDQLMLARRDIGVPEKNTLMLAIRELTSRTGLTRWVYPIWQHFKFNKDYKVISIMTAEGDMTKRKIEQLEKRLQQLRGDNDAGPFGKKAPDSEEA